jgi:hypothetical protein
VDDLGNAKTLPRSFRLRKRAARGIEPVGAVSEIFFGFGDHGFHNPGR